MNLFNISGIGNFMPWSNQGGGGNDGGGGGDWQGGGRGPWGQGGGGGGQPRPFTGKRPS